MTTTPATTGQAFAEANGIRLCYEILGDPASPPLLLISGLGSQLIQWRDELVGELAGRGFRVIRFDNRDTGLSTHLDETGLPDLDAVARAMERGETPSLPYTLRDMAADAAGLLKALNIESAHVAGASMGGRIAQFMAMDHPERVRTLTIMVSHMGDPAYPPPSAEAVASLRKPAPADREGYQGYSVALSRLLCGRLPLDEAYARAKAGAAYDRAFHQSGVARQLAALTGEGNAVEALRRLAVPTLVIHGSDDPLISVDAARAMAEAVPGAELLVIEGMGHTVNECPAAWPGILDAVARHGMNQEKTEPHDQNG